MNNKGIIVYADKTAIDIFKQDGVDFVLNHIKKEALDFKPDATTAKGRQEIASQARKVASSKVLLETARKKLVEDWTQKTRVVNQYGKQLRDALDILRDQIRKPYTDWEQAEKDRIEAKRIKEELEQLYDEAILENELFDRQREIEIKEAKIAAHEKLIEEKRAKDREQQRIDDAVKFERENAAREKELAEIQKRQEIDNARQKEQKRLENIQKEKQLEIEREEARLKHIAKNKEHQKQINIKALNALITETGIDSDLAKNIIISIHKGLIPNVTINY